jgi:hypothetical protein
LAYNGLGRMDDLLSRHAGLCDLLAGLALRWAAASRAT